MRFNESGKKKENYLLLFLRLKNRNGIIITNVVIKDNPGVTSPGSVVVVVVVVIVVDVVVGNVVVVVGSKNDNSSTYVIQRYLVSPSDDQFVRSTTAQVTLSEASRVQVKVTSSPVPISNSSFGTMYNFEIPSAYG